MATNDKQITLDRLLDELKSNEPVRCIQALEELDTLNFSSPALLREIEKLAIHHPDETVKARALQSLHSSAHQYIHKSLNRLTHGDRLFLLKEIGEWKDEGLLPANIADVIAGHYDFDLATPRPLTQTMSVTKKEEPSLPPVSPPPAVPAGPRPTLMQTLLSEASIKIYLYLGAFFVIASALILAALVEAARLPILAVATLAFAGGALGLRRRLPQPSFALFIVFSFLLPIDANVLGETIGFSEPFRSIYWTTIFLLMTAIWAFSVWFYVSRFFGAVAFVSLSLTFYRAGTIFNGEAELPIFLLMLASLLGLAGTFVLRKWKDSKFALFIFLPAQVQVLGLLFASLVFAAIRLFGSKISSGWWPMITLTWLTAASFYVLSDLLTPTFFFPWMAVAVLLPLPWFFLKTFDVTQPAYALGFWAWGSILAIASEAGFRLRFERTKNYSWAMLAGSLPLFLIASLIALEWDTPGFTFIILALIALVYGALHLLRPRSYLWAAGLISGSLAYFMFFYLPVIARLEIPYVYQFLIAAVLLVVPELFTKSPLSWKSKTRLPALLLGILVSLFGMMLALVDLEHTGRGALALLVYSILFTLHAIHSKKEWIAYFGAATEALTIVYALHHFHSDLWLPALTLMSVLYYVAGFFFRRRAEARKAWGNVLIQSGLALGILLSFTAFILVKETSGWYILIIALLFAVEIFARPFAWLELAVEILLSISVYQIANDFQVTRIEHVLFGVSLVWLGGDLIFHSLVKAKRIHRPIVLVAGYGFVAMSTIFLWSELNSATPTVYFLLYAFFFAIYAWLQKEPRLGYFVSAFLPLMLIKFCNTLHFEKWIFPLIALAIFYYGVGYWLRQNRKAPGWEEMLRYSGLGLGVLTSVAVPFQGGLEASIPVAIAATLFAVEAFALRNVWWALPANLLYLLSYFMILTELQVDEPQYYSIGAALLGMLMHYLLTRAGSRLGTFVAGMLSQLVLLGTTYIQMVSTERLLFFFVLFVQSLIVLVYGMVQRSRSLVVTPIAFAVLGVITIVYSALKGLGPVILVGSTGMVLLMAGIAAVLMRERISKLGEQLSEWKP